MSAVLLDSDVVIDVFRQREPGVLSRWEELGRSAAVVVYSPVTAAEVWHGAREAEQEAIAKLFAVMTCVPIDEAIGRKAGEYLRGYRRSHGVELGDALIAATAAVHQLELWTSNRRHYPMKDVRHF